ncbi:MAG: phosphonate ABC transporter ATP-binding protein [Rhizobiales bacterium]|nr:phosphonate ABC transporter ATP-binding protein [Hyphomicrobiales bacterium]
MLLLEGVSRRFGNLAAVNGVSLSVEAGSFVGVIGRSGAGKSTLLRLINRLVEPSEGRVSFHGTDVTALQGRALRQWRARSAMIFQQFNLVPRLDVLTNVLIGRLSHHATLPSLFNRFTAAERTMAVESLDRLDLTAHAFQRADTLSGGQQQRVAIARALMQDPAILLADEPIASLDPRNAACVMDSLQSINRESGLTILCNLHTLDAARQYCDRIIGMAKGKIVFDGAPAALTPAATRQIYHVPDGEDLSESITSTIRRPVRQPEIAVATA